MRRSAVGASFQVFLLYILSRVGGLALFALRVRSAVQLVAAQKKNEVFERKNRSYNVR
jgi:hypothetical protein